MKLKRAHIRNFKGIKEVEIDFMGSSGPRWLTALLGDNGSGKTTVLQAIAFVMSLASGRTQYPYSFNWPGFEWERISSLGDTKVELVVLYSEKEYSLIDQMLSKSAVELPAQFNDVFVFQTRGEQFSLTFEYEFFEISKLLNKNQGQPSKNENESPGLASLAGPLMESVFKLQRDKRQSGSFPALGQVYWFNQLRNIGSVNSGPVEPKQIGLFAENWRSSVEDLREVLIAWWGVEKTDKDSKADSRLKRLEDLLGKLFPGTKFGGMGEKPFPATTPLISDYYFLLERDGNKFDIIEMSSGEQAIFPLLFEFVRLDIAESSSLVLIDELELHLHPPEQQALYRALPIIGPDCQYIITTHSEVLTDVIPSEWEVRLDKGRVI